MKKSYFAFFINEYAPQILNKYPLPPIYLFDEKYLQLNKNSCKIYFIWLRIF